MPGSVTHFRGLRATRDVAFWPTILHCSACVPARVSPARGPVRRRVPGVCGRESQGLFWARWALPLRAHAIPSSAKGCFQALRPVLARRTKADASPEPPPAKPHAGSDAVFANRQLHVLRTTGSEAALWLHPRGNRDLVERHRQERAPRERIEKPIRGKSRSFAFAKMTLAR